MVSWFESRCRQGIFLRFMTAWVVAGLAVNAHAGDKPAAMTPPEAEAVAKETEIVRAALRQEYELAESSKDPRGLISVLTKRAELSDSPARRYALMREAERLALEGELFGVALRTAQERSRLFRLPIWTERMAIIDAMAKVPALESLEQSIDLACHSARLAVSGELFEVAESFVSRLSSLLASYEKKEKAREVIVRKDLARYLVQEKKRNPRARLPTSSELTDKLFVHRRSDDYGALVKRVAAECAEATRRFKEGGADRAASAGKAGSDEMAGMRLCLDRCDWSKGIAALASGTSELARLARREVEAGSTMAASARLELANDWWAAGEKLGQSAVVNDSDVASVQTHAARLYMDALPSIDDALVVAMAHDRVQSASPPRILLDVGTAAERCDTAQQAELVYEMELAKEALPAPQRQAAEVQRERWKLRKDAGYVRHGDEWLLEPTRQKMVQDAERRTMYGLKLLIDGKPELAKAELVAASELDKTSPIAESVIGWVYLVMFGNELLAAEHYLEAMRRAPSDGLVLVNLANCELLTGRHADAFIHYERALDHLPDAIVANNIGWTVKHSDRLGMLPHVVDEFNGLYRRALADRGIDATDNMVLLFLRPLKVPAGPDGEEGAGGRKSTEPVILGGGSGTGFVVAPGYVVTNHHVIEGATEIMISDPEDSRKQFPATVVASLEGHASGTDLALLRCEKLTSPPVALAPAVAPRGEDIMALGFPDTTVVGRDLKSTRGAVVSAVGGDGTFYLDCIINPGNSGGPIIDGNGNVIGVVVAITRREVLQGNSYSIGIPVEAVRAFLEKALPSDAGGVKDGEVLSSPLKWSEADARVSKSTVFIQTIIRRADHSSAGDAANPPGEEPPKPAEEPKPEGDPPAEGTAPPEPSGDSPPPE